MQILTDVHTHTIASVHAYSTLYENITVAKNKGLELIAMTDHGNFMADAPHEWHFLNTSCIPRTYEGVKILTGIELNVLNRKGEVDLDERILRDRIDVAIASIHNPTYCEEQGGDHTETWLNVIKNPYIDILGHSGSPMFPYDIERVVTAAKKANICIEINNNSTVVRPQNHERCKEIAAACKRIGANIVVSSDAHFMSQIGEFSSALSILEEIDFPEDLIMNLNAERFIGYIEKKKNKKFDFGE